ncbi:caspase family protein [Streptomyces camelliae]|uniref:Caspase family protein n=1 Tax=Streptomyces camelliae TaxID=3004093 RepID=A0ABY7NXX3_9ACTN|nr:caspase family protein [Streptomyces sp. HUAS 2-6]WBO63096.1 caspase family protein [Streptomyces sp. HUAS 2-6]
MPAEDGARRYLLATAVPRYHNDPQLDRPELAQARDDVIELFTKRFGYEHVTTLGLNPTAVQLTQAVRDFCVSPDRRPDDLVVLYIAAHGEVIEINNRHVLLTSEYRPTDLAAALPTDDLARAALLETPVRRFLLILDTCFSGRGGDQLAASAVGQMALDWGAEDTESGFVVLSSAQKNESAESGAFPALLREAVDALAGAGGVLPLGRLVQQMQSSENRPGYQRINWHPVGLNGDVPPFLALPAAAPPPRPATPATPLSAARQSGAGPLFTDAEPPLLQGIDGEQRRKAALQLWERWTKQRRSAALLHGFSGVGKTDRVVRPLMDEARLMHGRTTVLVDVPEHPVDATKELLARLHEQLEHTGHYELADALAPERRLDRALTTLLNRGVLVVFDEFQRLLDERGRPVQPIADDLKTVVAPGRHGDGCLWLVSNQKADPVWAQDFSPVELPPPPVEDAVRILVGTRERDEAEEWFPPERREEVVERLGRNPFVLRLLHSLVGPYDWTLEELLGPPSEVPQAPYDLSLVETIEKELVAKATERLTPSARAALRNLSVLADWAGQDLVKAMTRDLGDFSELRKQLQKRFLLQVRTVDNETTHTRSTHFQVHPAVREVVCVRMREDEKAWKAAHRRAGLWYARPLYAQDPSRSGDHRLALALSAARLHFSEGKLDDELARMARTIGGYLERKYGRGRYHHSLPESPAELSARIELMEAYLTDGGSPYTHHHLAMLLRLRDAPGDLKKALVHAREATRGRSEMYPWSLLLKLVRDVEGPEATVREGRIALAKVREQKFAIYDEIAKCEVQLGRVPQALETLREGCEQVKYKDAYRLADHAVPYAAAEPTEEPLVRTARWLGEIPALTAQTYLAEVLLLQRRGQWLDSARTAQRYRPAHPKVINLALYEAIGWLGAGDPVRAQAALDSFPEGIPNSPRPKPHEGKTWLVSLIALHGGNLERAREMFALYRGAPREDDTAEELRTALLYEWDHPEARMDESNPAFVAPVLPPSVTGLLSLVVRPQYGPPVLPGHH